MWYVLCVVCAQEVYDSLDAAVEALTAFQSVLWSPLGQREPPPHLYSNGTESVSVGDTAAAAPPVVSKVECAVLLESAASQPMHPSVSRAVASYCGVLDHPRRTPKMVEAALECTFLLIANRYVSGQAAGGQADNKDEPRADKDTPSDSDIDRLIHSLCASADSVSDLVQTFTVKSLLALTTSSICSVHEGALLKALRTIFQIHLASKHATNRDVSKAALFDMVRTVLVRLETYHSFTTAPEAATGSLDDSLLLDDTHTTTDDTEHATAAAPSPSAASLLFKDLSKGINVNVDIDAVIQKDDLSTFASKFHIDTYLVFRSLCKMSAKALPGDNTFLEGNKFLGNTQYKLINAFSSSMGANVEDPLAFRSKVLSLELILSMLEHSGHAFGDGERFIFAIQNYLCVSLLKNCISTYMAVAQLALKIFLVLVYKFKHYLKEEIEVFISKIFLMLLDSPNSPYEQRRLVLESLRVLCSEPQVLTQIFLEYDCDFDAPDLYKNILDHLTSLVVRILSNTNNNKAVVINEKLALHDSSLIVAGMDVLVTILRAFLQVLDLPGAQDDEEIEGQEENHYYNKTRNDKVRGLLHMDSLHHATKKTTLVSKMSASEDLRSSSLGRQSSLGDANISETDLSQYSHSYSSTADTPLTPGHTTTTSTGAAAAAAGSIIDTFDKKREGKRNFETGMIKFSLSAKQGLMFFIETGFLTLDVKEIALFLHRNKDKLNKTQIGELLGREPDASFVKDKSEDPEKGGEGFYVRLLHHYVNAMNFAGIAFDDAIRLFLSGFRLPGEAQKVREIAYILSFLFYYMLHGVQTFNFFTCWVLTLPCSSFQPICKHTCPWFLVLIIFWIWIPD